LHLNTLNDIKGYKMSSNIQVTKICNHCGNEFTAKTTVTQYCGDTCAKRAYKDRQRELKINKSNDQVKAIKNKPVEDLKHKEFLTAREVSILLNCSLRSVYYYIKSGKIKAHNLAERSTRIRRLDIDKLFELPQPIAWPDNDKVFENSECYTLSEIQEKYSISETGLKLLIERNDIPKFKRGRFAYIPKAFIDKLF